MDRGHGLLSNSWPTTPLKNNTLTLELWFVSEFLHTSGRFKHLEATLFSCDIYVHLLVQFSKEFLGECSVHFE